jgi:PucR C-terminal helix-turn-helix domain/GGDEF-like domain
MRIEEVRSDLVARLRRRQEEIEEATLTRVYGVSEPPATTDPEYVRGLRLAVAAAIDYGLEALERSEERTPPIPTVLLAQARLAARCGISLDTVLRRYLAGYTLLGDFVMQEAEKGMGIRGNSLQRLLRAQAALLDRLLAAVGEEYSREDCARPSESTEQRRAERVRRLLAGELVDAAELAYEFEGNHLGLIAAGPGAARAVSEMAGAADRRLLLTRQEQGVAWAWLGSRRGFDPDEVLVLAASERLEGLTVAFGEPANGLAGWRLTHRQAKAALPVALRGGESPVRYGEVALMASILRDELLTTSLRDLLLTPLERDRDRGKAARETLRAYFEAERNVSSAAAALGVHRDTVAARLRAVEATVGRSLATYAAEFEVALRIEKFAAEAAG